MSSQPASSLLISLFLIPAPFSSYLANDSTGPLDLWFAPLQMLTVFPGNSLEDKFYRYIQEMPKRRLCCHGCKNWQDWPLVLLRQLFWATSTIMNGALRTEFNSPFFVCDLTFPPLVGVAFLFLIQMTFD